MNQEIVKKVFDYASKELYECFMFMGRVDGCLQFKHKLTRQYISIPDWTTYTEWRTPETQELDREVKNYKSKEKL